MALFSQEALNPGVRKREVFGWAMYDFANSGYTTVVHYGGVQRLLRGGGRRPRGVGHLRMDCALSVSYAIVVSDQPLIGAYADVHAAKKRLLAVDTVGCVLGTAALALVGPGDRGLGDCADDRLERLLSATART